MGDDIIAIATADAIGQQLLADALKEIAALREEVAELRAEVETLGDDSLKAANAIGLIRAEIDGAKERLDNLEDIVDTVTGPLDF